MNPRLVGEQIRTVLKEQRLTFRQTAQAELNTKLAELAN